MMHILKKEWSQRTYDKLYILWGLVVDPNYDAQDWHEVFGGKVDLPTKWIMIDVAKKPYEMK